MVGDWVQGPNGWSRELAVPAATPEIEKSQFDNNLELLVNSEMGVLLTGVYKAAVAADPRLAEAIMVPYDDKERGSKGSAFARRAESTQSGKPEIHVRLGEIDPALDLLDETLQKVPNLREIIADKLFLEPQELTPLQLHAFIFVHELGHIREFANYQGNMPELRARQKAEKDALPLGNIATSALIDPNSPGGQFVRENWEAISKEHGVESIDELAALKNLAHRNMTSEKYADNFAADVLNREPTLLEQLGTDNIEQYRHYPVGLAA